MEFSWLSFALPIAVVFVGGFTQGTVGFGLALVVVPVLGQVNPEWVPGPILLVTLLLSVVIVWREGRDVDRRALVVPMLGQLIGIGAALIVLAWIAPWTLSILTGSIVLVAVALSSLGLRIQPTAPSLVVAGTLAGFMGTTASIPGPPLALLHQHVSPTHMRGTLAYFFVVGNSLSLVGLAWTGRLSLDQIGAGLILFPAAVLGYAGSSLVVDRLPAALIRRLVLIFSAFGAVLLIYKAS